jgi:hypothetical protein
MRAPSGELRRLGSSYDLCIMVVYTGMFTEQLEAVVRRLQGPVRRLGQCALWFACNCHRNTRVTG